jgi:hypothetical protein
VTRPPPDGRTKYAGYANFKSVMRRKSFFRVSLSVLLLKLVLCFNTNDLGLKGHA